MSLEEKNNPFAAGANLKHSKKKYHGIYDMINKLISTACMCSIHFKSPMIK
jgi:hypothetical protein